MVIVANLRSAGTRRAAFICALLLVNCCIATADGSDDMSDPEAAYHGERGGVLDLLEKGEGGLQERQVLIEGDTSILATLRTFGQGGELLQVSDQDSGVGMSVGTDSLTQKFMRLKPRLGRGLAINSAEDKVGVFVDGKSGFVGVGHDQPKAELHVKGAAYSSGTITAAAGDKPAVLLSGVSNYQGIQFGRDGQGQFLIGRGANLESRELSFNVPSAGAFGGGEQPKFSWVSGSEHVTLAELEGETGNMYFKGSVGVGTSTPKAKLDVRGSVNIQNPKGEAVINFPKGKGSSFSIRSSDSAAQTKDQDSHLYISGENGFTGIATDKPKSMLDVRGALNLQDAQGSAVVYFPNAGGKGNFYLRCADTPSKYEPGQERLFVGSNGLVGIGTSKPTHGLTLDSPAPPGSKQHDIAIPKGNLHLGGAIRDVKSKGKYYLDLKKGGWLRSLSVQTALGVGTVKPEPAAPGAAVIHIRDPKAPLLKIESTAAGGKAALELQALSTKWTMAGTAEQLQISRDGKPQLTVSNDGKVGFGAGKPTHGLTVSSEMPAGHPMNDVSIPKGNLWLGGSIKQMPDSKGVSKYSLSLDGEDGLLKELSVESKLGVGLGSEQPEFNLELGAGKVMSLGKQMFLSGESNNGYIAANMYRKNGEWALENPDEGAAVVALKSGGQIEISGTSKPGTTLLTPLMTIDAASQVVAFPMRGGKAGFGTPTPQYPVHVVGSTKVGQMEASVGFGSAQGSMGFLGANSQSVFMGTKDGHQVLTLDQHTGNVGIGVKSPQSTLHVAGAKGASLSFGSSASEDTRAYIAAEAAPDGVNMVIGVNNPTEGQDKLTFKFGSTVRFGGTGPTVFNRGDTIFKSGNVGIGEDGFDKQFKLHVKGDAKVEGRVFVSKKRPSEVAAAKAEEASKVAADKAQEAAADHLDLYDLLEEGESTAHEPHVDVVDTMSKLSRIIRKQMKQMRTHDERIALLASQLETLKQSA